MNRPFTPSSDPPHRAMKDANLPNSWSPDLPARWEELLIGYVLGNLSEAEANELAQLRLEHPELEDKLNEQLLALQGTDRLINQMLLAQAPPAGLRDRILAAAEEPTPEALSDPLSESAAVPSPVEPYSEPSSEPILRSQSSFQPWLLLAGAATTLAALLLGLDGYRLRQELATTRQQLQSAQEQLLEEQSLVALLQQSTTGVFLLEGEKAVGNATLTSDNENITIALQNLPTLPEEKIYRLWALVEGVPVFCGQFVGDETGKITKSWTTPVAVAESGAAEIFVTAELRDSPKAMLTGEVVLRRIESVPQT